MADNKNELAKTEAAGALAQFDYGEFGSAGYEGTSREDFSIPYLSVLQQLSPQLKKKDSAYIDGAEEGMLLNTVTQEIFDGTKGILFQPCATQHVFVEWKPRTAGGGVVGVHECHSDVVKTAKANAAQFGKYKNGENDLVETFYMIGQQIDEGGHACGQLMITFTSTKIKVYKGIMTTLHAFTVQTPGGKKNPPLFANKLRISTVEQSHAGGDSYNFKITPAAGCVKDSLISPDDDLVASGFALCRLVNEGMAKIDHGGGKGMDAEETTAPF
jgi:hypothetical protein